MAASLAELLQARAMDKAPAQPIKTQASEWQTTPRKPGRPRKQLQIPAITGDITGSAVVDGTIKPPAFDIPPNEGQGTLEIIDEVAPSYLRACLDMANRAMNGQVNPMTEGDLPHKMALLLLHKVMPQRKWNNQAPEETPKEVKEKQRALKALLKRLADEGEVIVDGVNVSNKQGNGAV